MAAPRRSNRPQASGLFLPMRVWDLPTRLFHWALVLLVLACYLTVRFDKLAWHMLCGEAVAALLLWRILWGLFGSETARFRHFLASPIAAVRHLLHFTRKEPDTQIGHNAAGGWMVLVLLAVLLAQIAPDVAARVLQSLPNDQHTTVMHRIATMGPVSPEAIAMLEELLARRIAEHHGTAALKMGGARATADLMNAAGKAIERRVLRVSERLVPRRARVERAEHVHLAWQDRHHGRAAAQPLVAEAAAQDRHRLADAVADVERDAQAAGGPVRRDARAGGRAGFSREIAACCRRQADVFADREARSRAAAIEEDAAQRHAGIAERRAADLLQVKLRRQWVARALQEQRHVGA